MRSASPVKPSALRRTNTIKVIDERKQQPLDATSMYSIKSGPRNNQQDLSHSIAFKEDTRSMKSKSARSPRRQSWSPSSPTRLNRIAEEESPPLRSSMGKTWNRTRNAEGGGEGEGEEEGGD